MAEEPIQLWNPNWYVRESRRGMASQAEQAAYQAEQERELRRWLSQFESGSREKIAKMPWDLGMTPEEKRRAEINAALSEAQQTHATVALSSRASERVKEQREEQARQRRERGEFTLEEQIAKARTEADTQESLSKVYGPLVASGEMTMEEYLAAVKGGAGGTARPAVPTTSEITNVMTGAAGINPRTGKPNPFSKIPATDQPATVAKLIEAAAGASPSETPINELETLAGGPSPYGGLRQQQQAAMGQVPEHLQGDTAIKIRNAWGQKNLPQFPELFLRNLLNTPNPVDEFDSPTSGRPSLDFAKYGMPAPQIPPTIAAAIAAGKRTQKRKRPTLATLFGVPSTPTSDPWRYQAGQ